MKILNKLNLNKRLEMRGYQETIVSDIVSKFGINKPYVLGSCPSSGKTEMAIESIIRLIESNKVNRVLILAHSTNVLKENFYQRLMEYFNEGDVEIMRGQKNYNYDATIQVMIPQNIAHITGKFDLVVTDEAHHNVLAEDGNYSRIVEQVEPKFQLLLTGTPSKFVRENNLAEDQNDLPYYINTVGMDMVGFEYFHDVRFDLIRSAYSFTTADYNQNQDISSDTQFSLAETERTINNVIIGAVRNIALRNGITLSKTADCVLEGRKLIQEGKFGKTLIMCRSIEQANQVQEIISKLFKVQVKVSQSQNDTESLNLTKFKEGKFDFLCVVNRAREGYDDKKIVNLIDITMTHNIDLIYQMFCRVVRKDDTNPKPKLYLKVTSNAEGMPEYTMNIMTAALMLGATDNLSMFNGSNFRGIIMPRIERVEPTDEIIDNPIVDGVVGGGDEGSNVIRRRNISDLMALDLIRMFTDDHENLVNGNDRYAMTTLNESLNLLEINKTNTTKQEYFKILRLENINTTNMWQSKYKILSEKYSIDFRQNPWRLFNQTPNEFFDECFPDRIKFLNDKKEYINLVIKEGITSGSKWLKVYEELSKKYNKKYSSTFWKKFNQTQKEFFDECYPDKQVFYDNKEGYFKLFRNDGITTNHEWGKQYKKLSERDGVKYHSNPWTFFNYKVKEFFNECYINKNFCDDKNIYINLIKKENITGSVVWGDRYKELSERDSVNYRSNPWDFFNQTQKEFFNECYPEKKEFYSDKHGYFRLFKKESISNKHKWGSVFKQLSERDSLKYHSYPNKLFNQTEKEFFTEYKEWLNNDVKYKPAYLGEFSEMNKTWNTSNSNTNHKRLTKDPSQWYKYHKLYSKAREKWSEIPYIEISKKIKDRPEWIVGDFGCGENLLRKELKNKVHSFDHVAIDETVVSCDLTDIPLNNDVLDVVVFSLALMHTNYDEYLKEAYRVLKPYGNVFIAEPRQRWSDEEGNLDEERVKKVLINAGFRLTGEIKLTERFIYIDAIK